MNKITFDEPINISKNHFKTIEDFQIYMAQKLQEIELSNTHKEVLDAKTLEVNENYISLKELKSNLVRKEIILEEKTLASLKIQAEKEGEKIINYMERVLKEKANEFELTDDYKIMMDNLLDKHDKGQLEYISKEDFFKKMKR
ncbi:hypothetical protein [Polaribacter vadi]|uniref:hypothetical protein n=1 Tax=Polaribacter vadi TaxID=1774273 RepID=UPI0030EF04DA|tara:strand:- start:19158 stop:19586 length:429 start_codon:yes stop_codon:yes gene_type:complete